ncbi:MAG: MaoC family dehydratase N-terminal domain-containing protein [Hyphomicrobiaceae bacterium]
MAVNYITDEVQAIIGPWSAWIEAEHPLESSELRRFHQATMDPARRYWDKAYAQGSRYGGIVAPPALPVHAFRRLSTSLDDPFDNRADPEFDGQGRFMRPGLPKVPVPLAGILNGGYEYEMLSYARLGDRIQCRSRYQDIVQKDSKRGPMVLVVIEDEYRTSDGRMLLKSVNTQIMR